MKTEMVQQTTSIFVSFTGRKCFTRKILLKELKIIMSAFTV